MRRAGSLTADVVVLESDESDVGAQRTLAAEINRIFGGLDVLFVNAGIAELRALEQWDENAFDRTFAINMKRPFFLIQALLRCSRTRHRSF
jgi:NAD(P)-dependent dehydrogenase (short-subunit alcohol dehydrogenase family)